MNKHKDKLEVTKRKPPEKNKYRVHFETYPPLKEAMDRAANEKKREQSKLYYKGCVNAFKGGASASFCRV